MTSRLVALPLTKTQGEPGESVLKDVPTIGPRPHCTLHGAMLRVTPDRYWYRCATCNIGCEDTGRTVHSEPIQLRAVAESDPTSIGPES